MSSWRVILALAVAATVCFLPTSSLLAAGGSLAGAEAEAEHAAQEAGSPLAFDPDLAWWTFVVFLVLLGVLWKFAWGPISEALDRRERYIADNIAAAEQAQEEARQLLADYERRLAGAAEQVRSMLEEARRDAEHTRQQIIAEARIAAQAEQERAMREIRTATDAALKELSERSADLAVELAGKIIRAKISKQEQDQLVDEALNKFALAAPSQN
jgi:F-type H+-transporting ATPase subunit b